MNRNIDNAHLVLADILMNAEPQEGANEYRQHLAKKEAKRFKKYMNKRMIKPKFRDIKKMSAYRD